MENLMPCLWFDTQGHEAADFYISVFPNSRIVEANPLTVIFELDGKQFMALNGGPIYAGFTETISFVVNCETQADVDYYWDALTANGGEEGRCGWLKDRFGLSWQIVPSALPRLLSDPERRERVTAAFMKMNKLVIAELEAA
jgi:predicted 3-demethylubiquinone-9 3-methyltransferase (glyoxalase superfamily)